MEETLSKENVEVIDLENEMVIRFAKPYMFEGKEYKQVDLSPLEDITASDMIKAEKIVQRSGITMLYEMTTEYACTISAIATKMPIEFFKGLKPREAIKLKNKVTSFFYNED